MMSLPPDFEKYTRSLMGDELYDRLAKALDSQSTPTSIRLNPFKARGLEVSDGVKDEVVGWCKETGRYLKSRPNFTFDPLLHAGVYYVQEASSMFVDYVVHQLIHEPVRMLDLCAAPGGKSTALRAALPEGSLLFSNEPMRQRAQILSENIQKFGHEDVIVTNNYPRDYRKTRLTFDAILADVPCSGEGMFRKDEGARQEWSLQNVENCWRLQRDIISDVWDCLRPGGLLIYSTCTFNAHEDEENVKWIAEELGADFVELPIETDWNITRALTGNAPVYRFLPGQSRGEGLFLAVLRKHGTDEDSAQCYISDDMKAIGKAKDKKERQRKKNEKNKQNGENNISADCLQWLDNADDFVMREHQGSLFAIPRRWTKTFDMVKAQLKVIHAGICLGTPKGKDIIPDESLALSRRLAKETFTRVELKYPDAIAYLRKEAVALPEGTPRGIVAVCYDGHTLGFEKNIGNRANNLYPQEWRIKSTYVPDETDNKITKHISRCSELIDH